MDPEVSSAINSLVAAIIVGITTIFLPWAFSLFRAWAKAKIESVKNKEVRDAMNDALSRLDLTAETVVREINQTIREGVAVNGKLTPEVGHQLLQKAYTRTLTRLPMDAKATLEKAFPGILQAVVVGKIQKKVGDAKVCVT
jgi:ABC-type tungstate transport system substrate-binding protein